MTPVVFPTGVVRVRQMQAWEQATIRGGVASSALMEKAGAAVAANVAGLVREKPGPVIVLAGTGNNGGDGFVAARYLKAAGFDVSVAIAFDPAKIAGDARANLDLLAAAQVPVRRLTGGEDIPALLTGAVAVVDALLGTGTRGAPSAPLAAVIRATNTARLAAGFFSVAVDLPSGVGGDTGVAAGGADAAIKADVTVTFAALKPCHALYPGRALAGRVVVADIGLDPRVVRDDPPEGQVFDALSVARALPKVPPDAHKGTFGHVLVIGGSPGLAGAPSLAALAALRMGAGLVTWARPSSLTAPCPYPEVMTAALGASGQGGAAGFTLTDVPGAWALAATRDVVVLGPGLGRSNDTQQFVRAFLAEHTGPVVVDADALFALRGAVASLAAQPGLRVLTPHPGEAATLLDVATATVQGDRLAAVEALAVGNNIVAALKGAATVVRWVGDKGQARLAYNTTGSAALATGGTGDVLAGAIGALWAALHKAGGTDGHAAWLATAAAVAIHGRAGEVAGPWPRGVLASEIADRLPQATADFLTQATRAPRRPDSGGVR
jgi:ADP-dependent NAD(P)H-hydrate dehydratase / NAD(P)H-hydrate epimerase